MFTFLTVQHECIPQAILGMDVICQAKSGMGKTAVFVISTLQQLEPVDGQASVVVLCHTRELAFQICHEYERFTTYMKNVRVGNFFGGLPIKQQREMVKDATKCPHIIVGTPGRIKALAEEKTLDLSHVRHFVVDECDKCLESIDMRADVQGIFKKTPHDKQVMMFSATLSAEVRPVCKKFMRDVSDCISTTTTPKTSFYSAAAYSTMILIRSRVSTSSKSTRLEGGGRHLLPNGLVSAAAAAG